MNKRFLHFVMGILLALPSLAQEEDVTHYIQNAGFDQDLTWQADGSMKTIVDQSTTLSDRSIAGIAADGSRYALVNPSTPKQRSDGRTFEATNGFIGVIDGWEVVYPNDDVKNSKKCEWMYFGSVPYSLGTTAVPVSDDGNTYLTVPTKPEGFSGDDNVGMLYLRAGWTNSCSYKQIVSLPCAKYRLEYWTININENSTANATDLTNITCRHDVFKDETGTGLSSKQWTKHSFEFTPIAEFTIEFGFKAANAGSGANPIVCLDGIKLYKIGEADPLELAQSDLIYIVEQLRSKAEEVEGLGLLTVSEELLTAANQAEAKQNGTLAEMTAEYQNALAVLNNASAAVATIDNINMVIQQMDNYMSNTDFPGKADFQSVRNAISGYLTTGSIAQLLGAVAEAQQAKKDYMFSQIPSAKSPADYTGVIAHPWFIDNSLEPTLVNGKYVFPNSENYVQGQVHSDFTMEGWIWWRKNLTAAFDIRLNWEQGRSCFNHWFNTLESNRVAIVTYLSDLPAGYYSVSADMMTQPDCVTDQHVFASQYDYTTDDGYLCVKSPALTEGNFITKGEGEWTTLTTPYIYISEKGHLVLGAEGSRPESAELNPSAGWFLATNFHLYYYGTENPSQADMTDAIVNPNFDNASNSGWLGTAPNMVGSGSHGPANVAEVYNNTFDTYQDIEGLPAGVYALGAQTMWRGSWNDMKNNIGPAAFLYAKAGEVESRVPFNYAYSPLNTESLAGATPWGVDAGEQSYTDDATGVTYYIPNDPSAFRLYAEKGLYDTNVMFAVNEGEVVRIGVKNPAKMGDADNWSLFDTFTLTFYGSDADACQLYVNEAVKNFSEYMIEEGSLYTEAYLAAYNAARAGEKTAFSMAEVDAIIGDINDAKTALDDNIALWKKYQKTIENGDEMRKSADYDGMEETENLSDYIEIEYEDIIAAKKLTNEELTAEIEKLEGWMNTMDEKSKQDVFDGKDMTKFIKNPGFEEDEDINSGAAEGWTINAGTGGNITRGPLGQDNQDMMQNALGEGKYFCFEAWHRYNWDVWQEIENLPVGMYELQVQGYVRCEMGGYNRGADLEGQYASPVYLYMNNAMSQFPSVYSEIPADEGHEFTTVEGWTTEEINGNLYPNSMGGAAQCFGWGMYKTTAFGLIAKEGEKFRIGVKMNGTSDWWCIWDSFKLTYRTPTADLVQPLLVEELAKIDLTKPMEKTVFAQADAIVREANAAIASGDGQAMFDALTKTYDLTAAIIESSALFADLVEANENLLVALSSEDAINTVAIAEAEVLYNAIASGIENHEYEAADLEDLLSQIDDARAKLYIAEEPSEKIYRAELDASMFKAWDSPEAGANVVEEPEPIDDGANQFSCETNFYKELGAGAVVYGNTNVYYLWYADLTGSKKMIIKGTAGMQLRVQMNRPAPEEGGDDAHGGTTIVKEVTIADNGEVTLDLSDLEYVHLNCVKTGWGSPAGIISSISVVGTVKPVSGILSMINNGDAENNDLSSFFVALDAPNTETANDKPEIVEGGVDGSRCFKVTAFDGPTETWHTQFYIKADEMLPKGTKWQLKMALKADKATTITTSAQAQPREWKGGFIDEFIVDTEWRNYTWSGEIGVDDFQTIAFDLSNENDIPGNAGVSFYFDNIEFGIDLGGTNPMANVQASAASDVIQIALAGMTNMTELVKNVPTKTLVYDNSCASVTINGEPAEIVSIEGFSNGNLYIFLLEDEVEEDDVVKVAFKNPSDAEHQLLFNSSKFEGEPLPDLSGLEASYNDELGWGDYVSYLWCAPMLVEATPEDGSFDLPTDQKEFTVTFNQNVKVASVVAKLGDETLTASADSEYSKVIKLSRTSNGAVKGVKNLVISQAKGEKGITLEESIVLKYGFGPVQYEIIYASNFTDEGLDAYGAGWVVTADRNNADADQTMQPANSASGNRLMHNQTGYAADVLYLAQRSAVAGIALYGTEEDHKLELQGGVTYYLTLNSAQWDNYPDNGSNRSLRAQILTEGAVDAETGEIIDNRGILAEEFKVVKGRVKEDKEYTSFNVAFTPADDGNYVIRLVAGNLNGYPQGFGDGNAIADVKIGFYDALDDFVLGDVNEDGEVTTSDAVATIPFVLEQATPTEDQFKAADVNRSNSITVSDVVGIVNIILSEDGDEAASARSADRDINYLTLDDATLSLNNTTTFVAFQMDVTLSDAAILNGVRLADRAANLRVAYNRLSGNTYRIMAFSTDKSVILSNEGTLCTFNITGNQHVSISNIEFTDAAAHAYALELNDVTRISNVNAAIANHEIYSIDGVKSDKTRKGVNVVRSADGKMHKVFVK